jgi:cob(I)alamin adenosyltransferase
MKIYTKTGDQGTTALFGGKRVSKADLRIDTYGTVDELNSYMGLLRDQEVNQRRKEILMEIQDRLFTIGIHPCHRTRQYQSEDSLVNGNRYSISGKRD